MQFMLITFDKRTRPSMVLEILALKLMKKCIRHFQHPSNLINIEHYRSFRKTKRTEDEIMETDSFVADVEAKSSTRKDKGIFSFMCFNLILKFALC